MLFCADMGNSHISIGVFENEEIICCSNIKTDAEKTSDQYAADIYGILKINGVEPKKIESSILGSVVPSLTSAVKKAIEKITSSKCLLIGPGIKTGLNIRIDNPAQLGADLVCGAAAALNSMPLPCIIVDLGTASKMFVVTKDGSFIGGMIAAGVGISRDALASRTACLPQFEISSPAKTVCASTVDCMKSGTVIGTAAMVDGMIERFEEELGERASVVATGGYSHIVIPHCKRKITLNQSLILEGLKYIYEKNS